MIRRKTLKVAQKKKNIVLSKYPKVMYIGKIYQVVLGDLVLKFSKFCTIFLPFTFPMQGTVYYTNSVEYISTKPVVCPSFFMLAVDKRTENLKDMSHSQMDHG